MEAVLAALINGPTVPDGPCKGPTVQLDDKYYDAAVEAVFAAHSNDIKRIGIRLQPCSDGTISHVYAGIRALQTNTMLITKAKTGLGPIFIVGDVAVWPGLYCCAYERESNGYTLLTYCKVGRAGVITDILRYLMQYLPIQKFLTLCTTPQLSTKVVTLFPARFPYCPPVIMDKIYLMKYATSVPANGQLKIAQVSDAAASWLGQVRDFTGPQYMTTFGDLQEMEDIADILAVFAELGIS